MELFNRYVKTFECDDRNKLEKQINDFLEKQSIMEGIQIQYCAYSVSTRTQYTAMVFYKGLMPR